MSEGQREALDYNQAGSMRKTPFLRSIVIVCAVLSPFILATEPVPPPYHQFVLDGTVVRASNGDAAVEVEVDGKPKTFTPLEISAISITGGGSISSLSTTWLAICMARSI